MLKILPRKNTIKKFFTVNQLLKRLCETPRTVTKKKKILSLYKIPWMGKSVDVEPVTQNFIGQTDTQTNTNSSSLIKEKL